MALTITKAYSATNALLESHIDNFRNGLHTFFTGGITSASFSGAMSLPASKFTGSRVTTTDNSGIDFGTGTDASLGLDSSKNFVFNTTASTTEICFYAGSDWYIEFYSDKVNIPGDIIIAKGNANRTVLQCLSSYKKPVLEWAGASDVSIQCNSSDSSETILFFPTYVAAVDEELGTNAKYRQASITNTANGYGTGDTGAAKGGRRSGVSLTTNSWYTVYAVGLRSGTDYSATTAKFVLVFDTTFPTAANDATLDGYYGNGNWLYLGLIRYGYGVTGSNSSIIKFKQSNKGWCYFYGNDGGATYGGLTLAQATTNTDDTASPFYTLTNGTSGNVVPWICGHLQLSCSRADVSDWYVTDTTGDILWRGGWQTDDATFDHGFLIELPFISDGSTEYKFYQARKNSAAVDKRVTLAGFCDTFLTLRRGGHGI